LASQAPSLVQYSLAGIRDFSELPVSSFRDLFHRWIAEFVYQRRPRLIHHNVLN
jgi:hypothetical protein